MSEIAPYPPHQRSARRPPRVPHPSSRPTLEEARAWCRHLATTHYENFHVATFFLPNKVRPHFESIYAYCRVSDDLGDEVADPATALRLLDTWGSMLDECYDHPERSLHPVFVALHETIASAISPASSSPISSTPSAWTRSSPPTTPGTSCSNTPTTPPTP